LAVVYIGQFFSKLQKHVGSANFLATFSTVQVLHYIWIKWVWATFWAILSKTRLVTQLHARGLAAASMKGEAIHHVTDGPTHQDKIF
jgi:hypothetical protein